MNIKNFLSFFRKKNKSRHVKHLDNIKSKIPKGQEFVYWRAFINKNSMKIIIPIVSILLFSLLLLILIIPVTEEEIYSKNFIYSNYGVTRGTSDNNITYNIQIKDYEQAFKLLEKKIIHDSTQHMYIFYYSLMAMELGKNNIAQKYFIKLINNDNIFLDDAQWFLALSYLKTDKEKAIEEFRKISNDKNHYKRKKAKKILKQLQ